MSNIGEWFDPIRKVPLEYNGTKSNAWSVQREDLDDNSGWKEVGVVSNNYLLINNTDVEKLANDIATSSQYEWTNDKVFWNGRQFMYSLVAKDNTREVSKGDDVALGMMFWNSYDGSTALQFKLYLQRLVCLNGMVSNDIFNSYRFKHDSSSEGYDEQIIEAAKIIDNSEDNIRYFINALRYLEGDIIETERLAYLRENYLKDLPVSLFGNIIDKLLTYRPMGSPSAYDLLNASTNVLWHKKKSTKADFDHNAYITDGLIRYAKDQLMLDNMIEEHN